MNVVCHMGSTYGDVDVPLNLMVQLTVCFLCLHKYICRNISHFAKIDKTCLNFRYNMASGTGIVLYHFDVKG